MPHVRCAVELPAGDGPPFCGRNPGRPCRYCSVSYAASVLMRCARCSVLQAAPRSPLPSPDLLCGDCRYLFCACGGRGTRCVRWRTGWPEGGRREPAGGSVSEDGAPPPDSGSEDGAPPLAAHDRDELYRDLFGEDDEPAPAAAAAAAASASAVEPAAGTVVMLSDDDDEPDPARAPEAPASPPVFWFGGGGPVYEPRSPPYEPLSPPYEPRSPPYEPRSVGPWTGSCRRG